jgi:hypothetical protein
MALCKMLQSALVPEVLAIWTQIPLMWLFSAMKLPPGKLPEKFGVILSVDRDLLFVTTESEELLWELRPDYLPK